MNALARLLRTIASLLCLSQPDTAGHKDLQWSDGEMPIEQLDGTKVSELIKKFENRATQSERHANWALGTAAVLLALGIAGIGYVVFVDPVGRMSSCDATQHSITILGGRIAAVLLLMFLAKVLVGTYRHIIRLSVYYQARADALEFCRDKSPQLLLVLVSAFSPEKIEFGKDPAALDADVIAAIKDGVKSDKEK